MAELMKSWGEDRSRTRWIADAERKRKHLEEIDAKLGRRLLRKKRRREETAVPQMRRHEWNGDGQDSRAW